MPEPAAPKSRHRRISRPGRARAWLCAGWQAARWSRSARRGAGEGAVAGTSGANPLDADDETSPAPAWSRGNCVELLPLGEALFPALEQAWSEARTSIWLETYIFHDDPIGLHLATLLADAARRGVHVRVMVDGLGSGRSIPTLAALFAGSGVEFMVYRPWRPWLDLVQRGHWRRLHRKLCVVDGAIAFIGGINLIDDRLDIHHGWSAQPRLDYAVRVQGLVAQQAMWSMRRLWLRTVATGSLQRQLRSMPGPEVLKSRQARQRYLDELRTWGGELPPREDVRQDSRERQGRLPAEERPTHPVCPDGQPGMRAALVVRDNLLQRRAIEHSYIQAIDQARSHVLLVSPYFYPGQAFRTSLKRAAARGVQVTLLLQGRIDYRAAAWAAHALYRELLQAGVHICEYQRAYLHGKVAVVDESWATVGSSNIDPLSLLVNREANILVRDARFARDLTAHIRAELAYALPIDHARLQKRVSWWTRPLVALAARLFIAMAGGARNY
ncbi:MAG: cardiolipin synthase ClsB [Betaproteobacteria bacterium]|nr:cardiolipin synthase ClsB [Betaproteobacteria bacterium]MDE2123558.1 cardiolipin synthase ClsB [Betaproteobacteria bacterium]MDE2187339.1 cardiolipin synthase ClsB [Betaproteobacteria bacterium]